MNRAYPRGFPTLDPELVSRAGANQAEAIRSTSPSSYDQNLAQMRQALERQIQASRTRAAAPSPHRAGSVPNVAELVSSNNSVVGRINRGLSRPVASFSPNVRAIPRSTLTRGAGLVGLGLSLASSAAAANEIVRNSPTREALMQNLARQIVSDFANAQAQTGSQWSQIAGIARAAAPLIVQAFPQSLRCALFGQNCTRTAPDGTPIGESDRPADGVPTYGAQPGVTYTGSIRFKEGSPGTFEYAWGFTAVGPIGQPYFKNQIVYPDWDAIWNGAEIWIGNQMVASVGGHYKGATLTLENVQRQDGQPDQPVYIPAPGGQPQPPIASPLGRLTIGQTRRNVPSSTGQNSATAPSNAAPSSIPDPVANSRPQFVPSNQPATATPSLANQPVNGTPTAPNPSAPVSPVPTAATRPSGGTLWNFPGLPTIGTANGSPTPNPLAPFATIPLAFRPGTPASVPQVGSAASTTNTPAVGRPARATQTGTGTIPGGGTGTGTGTQTPTCLYDGRNISGKVDTANITLGTINTVLSEQVLTTVNRIDSKLGAQIPGGGIGGMLQKVSGLVGKTWNFLQIDRVLNVLTWIGVLHNGYQLSNSMTQTLFAMISNVLDVFGIEDSEGEALDVGQIVAGWTENFFKVLLGEETVDGMKDTWKRYNRIYQAAANLLSSIQSMFYSMAEITEMLSDYTGKVGNALKKSGVILENAFKWMSPQADFTSRGFFKWMSRTQDRIEFIDEVFQEVKSIQDTAAGMVQQGEDLRKALEEGEKKKEEEETKAKNDSTRPNLNISSTDERRAGE